MLEQDADLPQNQRNPFPVSGKLTLDDAGTLVDKAPAAGSAG